jgi:2-polyprenyl-3-methyl-5-hydroxy-6-metoxy-1,4-benzoquinol methylase
LTFLMQRDRQPELMDQPGLDGETHRRALAALGKTNKVCRVSRAIWRSIRDARILPTDGRPLRILDIASGGGDNIIGIAKLAARQGVSIEAHGCDINPTAVEYAQKAAAASGASGVQFFQLNALQEQLPEDYDVVMCTLFLHHLIETDAREMLRRMAHAAKRYLLVDDLRRNRLGYFYAWAGARLLTRSHIVHTDGPLSVRAAFSIAEVSQLAREAGWSDVHFRFHWPQRFLMTWKKP